MQNRPRKVVVASYGMQIRSTFINQGAIIVSRDTSLNASCIFKSLLLATQGEKWVSTFLHKDEVTLCQLSIIS